MNNTEMIKANSRAGALFINVDENNTLIDWLNKLITANRGLIELYETASEQLEDDRNIALVNGYINQHRDYIATIADMVVGRGGDPELSASLGDLLNQAWVAIKSAVTDSDGVTLSEIASKAEDVLHTYGDLMQQELPENVRSMVRSQMSEMRVSYEKLNALAAAYNQ